MRRRHAFTLIEILVVLAIIAVLVSIVVPVVSYARRSAYHSVGISNLHQLGIAQSLYEQSNNGGMAYGAPTLVAAGLVPKAILASNTDPYEQGQANAFIEMIASTFSKDQEARFLVYLVPYKLSYLGWRESNAGDPMQTLSTTYDQCIGNQDGAGWIVDPTYGSDGGSSTLFRNLPQAPASYERLENDGSAVHRFARYSGDCTVSKGMHCAFSRFSMYADGNDKWFNGLFSNTGQCNQPRSGG